MTRLLLFVLLTSVGALAADSPTPPAGYFNDFQKTAPGKAPDDMLVLNGEFAVKVEGDNHFLEVSPDPLDAFGALFGPDAVTLADVGAKIYATSTGRRYPEIGVGCGDAGGYKLMLVPGQASLELRRGDETVAHAGYDNWQSGQWFSFRVKVTPGADGKWRIAGKVWPASAHEPDDWSITYDASEAPPSGRASVWASPYSGTPVRFDDLSAAGAVAAAKGG
jgi:hypothetical protein